MTRQNACRVLAWAVVLVLLPAAGRAEITGLAGFVQAKVQSFRAGQPAELEEVSDLYPQTSAELPLQVVARLAEADASAAASVAAQFADPRLSTLPNPEEFAINLALLSVSPEVRYTGRAVTRETRELLFSPGELAGTTAGQTIATTGRLFLDGALGVFSPNSGQDLSTASVALRVSVVRKAAGSEELTVFSGKISLSGGPDGTVTQTVEDDFPTAALLITDLGPFVAEFPLFRLLLIPAVTIDYEFPATVGQPFTLEATLTVEAANAVDEVGVVAVLGTPVDTVRQVIAAAFGDALAGKTVAALAKERATPTGQPAFPAPALGGWFPLCGWFGLETLLGGALLVGLRLGGGWPRRWGS